jgi:hypothetical protein
MSSRIGLCRVPVYAGCTGVRQLAAVRGSVDYCGLSSVLRSAMNWRKDTL